MNDLFEGENKATGIKFTDCTPDGLGQAIGRALELYTNPDRLDRVRKNGMRADFSWRQTTANYDKLYESIN